MEKSQKQLGEFELPIQWWGGADKLCSLTRRQNKHGRKTAAAGGSEGRPQEELPGHKGMKHKCRTLDDHFLQDCLPLSPPQC